MKTKYYGIVEGFFSEPLPLWTDRERLRTIRFCARFCPKINVYLYCPKDDMYVATAWNVRYSKSEIAPIRNAFRLCKDSGVQFRYGLNPSLSPRDFEENGAGCIALIIKKMEQLLEMGIMDFCILYDDIPYAYYALSGLRAENAREMGRLQARTLNAVYAYLARRGGSLWFCPSDYFFTSSTPYTKSLRKYLNEEIVILWTGKSVFNKRIQLKTVARARATIGANRRMAWWDNYPVNDCEHTKETLHIGAFNGPTFSTLKELAGVLINPMRQADANYIAYLTLERYAENPAKYSRAASLRWAFRTLFGPRCAPWYQIYASFSAKNIADDMPREYLKKLLAARNNMETQKTLEAVRADLQSCEKARFAAKPARQFALQTRPIIRKARAFLRLASGLERKKNLPRLLRAFDPFPVVIRKNYIAKVAAVLEKRVAATASIARLPGKLPRQLITALRRLRALVEQYRLKSKREIPARDERLLRAIASSIIRKEEKLFLEGMTARPITAAIKAVVRRVLTNGY